MTWAHLQPYACSTLIGLLLGLERERSRVGSLRIAAGVRTFALVALFGTLAAEVGTGAVVVGLAVLGAVLAISYRRTSAQDPGTTTEVAALTTYLLGVLCHRDAGLAVVLGILVALLLTSKSRLHRFARSVVSEQEAHDAIEFLVIAFVVLPVLPDRNLGPYGVLNPRNVWLVVVILSGISFAGYVAVRALGARRGLLVTGFAGGFLSAAATTASMARLSRAGRSTAATVAAAQVASIATFLELLAILWVVSPAVIERAWPSLCAGIVLLGAVVWLGARHVGEDPPGTEPPPGRPFELRPALVLAVLLTVALLVGRWAAATFGPKGVMATAGAAGVADAHAGSLAATGLFVQHRVSMGTVLVAIGVALLANTLTKCVLAYTVGGRQFGRRFSVGVAPVYVVVLGALAATAALL